MTRTFSDGHPKVLPACNFLSQYYFYNIFLQKSCRFSLQTLTKFEAAKTGSGVGFLRLTAVWIQTISNLVPRAHVPFGQYQDTETKILGLPVSRRTRGLVYMPSRDKVDVDTFHKGIRYAQEKLGKSKFGIERTAVSNF